jgi:undecaprenyl-diphosphatase
MSTRSDVVAAAGGYALLAGAAVVARRRVIVPTEQDVFRSINTVPGAVVVPLRGVMQAGSLGGALAVSAVTAMAADRRLGETMGVTGTAVWAGCKVVKRLVRRGRPADHLGDVTIHGTAQSGLGFPSGHTAVTFALASLLAPHLPPQGAALAWIVAGATGTARMAVGAHLPLDVVGGAAFGLAAAATARLVVRRLTSVVG